MITSNSSAIEASSLSSESLHEKNRFGDDKPAFQKTIVSIELPQTDVVSGDLLDHGLRRGLKGRQFVIIALGSIIGPSTFYGLGYAIFLSGPLGLLIGFGAIGKAALSFLQELLEF